VAADGSLRVVDYKTARSVSESREGAALFQLRVYGLNLYRTRGVVPKVLQLIYLGNAETISYEPDLEDLLATERLLHALRRAIATAERTGDWQPRKGPMCSWCSFKTLCPEYGGTPPPVPDRELTAQKETVPLQT
jgi:putative RecB family exonuclease